MAHSQDNKWHPAKEHSRNSKESALSQRFSFPLSKEVGGLLMLSISSMLLISVFSFSMGDIHHNYLGLIGYYCAYALQYLFGLSSYLILTYCIWLGCNFMRNRSPHFLVLQILYVIMATASSCILLNLFAERFPHLAIHVGKNAYIEVITIQVPYLLQKLRYNLGGVPFYYLYRDLPVLNLHRLFSDFGTFMLSFTGLILSTTLILQFSWSHIANRLIFNIETLKKMWNALLARQKAAKLLKQQSKATQEQPTPVLLENSSSIKTPGEEALFPSPYQQTLQQPLENSIRTKSLHQVTTASIPSPHEKKLKPPSHPQISTTEKPYQMAEQSRSPVIETQQITSPVKRDIASHISQISPLTPQEGYQLPIVSLLKMPKRTDESSLNRHLQKQAEILHKTLLNFGIEATVGDIHCGPRITLFEIHPAIGVKVQKIKVLENDIALNMQASSIRIIAPIPGKAAVGIEIPSPISQEVGFKEILEGYQNSTNKCHIPVLLGKNVSGQHVISDLAKMPHCIIAGATGSGKSVCINTIVISILMNASPDEVKLLMVDPKKVELTPYSHLPHMIAPVITEPQEAYAALNWLVKEMEYRYEVLKQLGVRNITAFNHRRPNPEIEASLEINIPKKMFYIVGIIDELADLMMVSNCDIETPIARIAQMARAVGIHLILATQRPSREVITGLIKANFPTRIAFKVASRVNSQIILDEVGAESLLGNGDMLFLPPGSSTLIRAQGAYISDEEIQSVIDSICSQRPTNYLIRSFNANSIEVSNNRETSKNDKKVDSLYEQAVNLVLETGNASTTFLQRKLKVGYARAASLIDQLEEAGIIGPQEGNNKARKIIRAHKNSTTIEDDGEEASGDTDSGYHDEDRL
ncbi:MAG: ftsK [Chlamydiales bacterium]|jgi:S-DNA-T family DNA segregation ATPase FtsK/SpoIIIE|nr:ftsK [Chlamydiales bacterium]